MKNRPFFLLLAVGLGLFFASVFAGRAVAAVQTLTGAGSQSTYGSLTISGSKNGYYGINFGPGDGTLMMNSSTSGFYNAADNGWRFYVDDSGNGHFGGTVYASTFSGALSGTESAANVSAGSFGSNTGGGNYTFSGNVGIGTTSPNSQLANTSTNYPDPGYGTATGGITWAANGGGYGAVIVNNYNGQYAPADGLLIQTPNATSTYLINAQSKGTYYPQTEFSVDGSGDGTFAGTLSVNSNLSACTGVSSGCYLSIGGSGNDYMTIGTSRNTGAALSIAANGGRGLYVINDGSGSDIYAEQYGPGGYAVYGQIDYGGVGVYGNGAGSPPYVGTGVEGTTGNTSGYGVEAINTSGTAMYASGATVGVFGTSSASATGDYGVEGTGGNAAVAGINTTGPYGVYAQSSNIAVDAYSTGAGAGVYATEASNGNAVYAACVSYSGCADFRGGGGEYTSGGNWVNASSRSLKTDFTPLNDQTILNKIAALPITQWVYKSDPTAWHIGPVAEDFYADFGLGDNNTSISTIDPAGVALVGVQALDQDYTAQQSQITDLQNQVKTLETQNATLTQEVNSLLQK